MNYSLYKATSSIRIKIQNFYISRINTTTFIHNDAQSLQKTFISLLRLGKILSDIRQFLNTLHYSITPKNLTEVF